MGMAPTESYDLDLAITLALNVRKKAKLSHSRYRVGACIVGRDTRDILTYVPGSNIELHGCPPYHAEVVAYLRSTIYEMKEYCAIVIACDGGFPACGSCRQLLINVNPFMRVISVDTRLSPPKAVVDAKLSDLLPMAYPVWQGEELSRKTDST